MRAPSLEHGQVEQAIFTWSTRNVTGVRGQSFGSVSPGLKSSGAWLNALDTTVLQPRSNALTSWKDAYPEWRTFAATCATTVLGDLSMVYRKVADAGTDPQGRVRSLAHCLIARRDSLDIAAVDPADSHWLTAADCPLDKLPKLATLQRSDFSHRLISAGTHQCAQDDDAALSILKALMVGGGLLDIQESPALARAAEDALLVALPVELWPAIHSDWYVTATGPSGRITVTDGPVQRVDANDRDARLSLAGLQGCLLHQTAERLWTSLAGTRSWSTFVRAKQAPAPTRLPSDRASAIARSTHFETPDRPATARVLAQHLIRDAIDDGTWSFENSNGFDLDETQLRLVLPILEDNPPASGNWIRSLNTAELWQVFAGAKSYSACKRTATMIDRSEATVGDLLKAWRNTGVAALGFALARRANQVPGSVPDGWAVPRNVNEEELTKLVTWAVTANSNLRWVVTLLMGGLASTPQLRAAVIPALKEAGCSGTTLFRTVLPAAALAPDDLLDIIREAPAQFTTAFNLPQVYLEAIQRGLPPRRSRRLPPLRRSGPGLRRRASTDNRNVAGDSPELFADVEAHAEPAVEEHETEPTKEALSHPTSELHPEPRQEALGEPATENHTEAGQVGNSRAGG